MVGALRFVPGLTPVRQRQAVTGVGSACDRSAHLNVCVSFGFLLLGCALIVRGVTVRGARKCAGNPNNGSAIMRQRKDKE